jgi:hypothetical protein
VVLRTGLQEHKGGVMTEAGVNPHFNQTFTFQIDTSLDTALHIDVWDEDAGAADHIGRTDIPIADLVNQFRASNGKEQTYPIFDRNKKSQKCGDLVIKVTEFVNSGSGSAASSAPGPARVGVSATTVASTASPSAVPSQAQSKLKSAAASVSVSNSIAEEVEEDLEVAPEQDA